MMRDPRFYDKLNRNAGELDSDHILDMPTSSGTAQNFAAAADPGRSRAFWRATTPQHAAVPAGLGAGPRYRGNARLPHHATEIWYSAAIEPRTSAITRCRR